MFERVYQDKLKELRLEDDKQKSLSSPVKESQSNLEASESKELIEPNLDLSMYKERND